MIAKFPTCHEMYLTNRAIVIGITGIREVIWVIHCTMNRDLMHAAKMLTVCAFGAVGVVACAAIMVGIVDIWLQGTLFFSVFVFDRMQYEQMVSIGISAGECLVAGTAVVVWIIDVWLYVGWLVASFVVNVVYNVDMLDINFGFTVGSVTDIAVIG